MDLRPASEIMEGAEAHELHGSKDRYVGMRRQGYWRS